MWTTTPWTLPSNQAVCYAANQTYALAQISAPSGSIGAGHKLVLVWAEALLDQLRKIVGSQVELVCLLQGTVCTLNVHTLLHEYIIEPYTHHREIDI